MIVIPLLLIVGCRSDGHSGADKCADIPPGAIPRPAGTYACQWQHAQIDRANQENYVIYENEWYQGGRELGPTGQVQVGDLAHHLDETPCKVFIVPHFDVDHNSWNNDLNKQRVEYVVGLLTTNGVTDAAQRVQIALPHAEGLYGEEAVRIGAPATRRFHNNQCRCQLHGRPVWRHRQPNTVRRRIRRLHVHRRLLNQIKFDRATTVRAIYSHEDRNTITNVGRHVNALQFTLQCWAEEPTNSSFTSRIFGSSDKLTKNSQVLPPAEAAKACISTADEMAKGGYRKEAILLYERARQLDPGQKHVCRYLAVLYDEEGDDAKGANGIRGCTKTDAQRRRSAQRFWLLLFLTWRIDQGGTMVSSSNRDDRPSTNARG